MRCRHYYPTRLRCKHTRDIKFIGEISINFLAALGVSFWFTGKTVDSHWSIILPPIEYVLIIAKRLFEGSREIVILSKALKYVLLVHGNLLASS
jgi:hypothetical protein